MKSDLETRERLLRAAERLFAERGFKKVTVREICCAAGANVAAVNYHFGDKLGLYREVMQAAIDRMRATSDAAREAGKGQPAEEQLRRYIHIIVRRVLARDTDRIHEIVMREVHDPTPALDALVEHGLRPRIEYLSGILAKMLRCLPSDPRVLRCVASIQSQTLAYLHSHGAIADRLGMSVEPRTAREIDEIARHIAAFSLAGVRAVAERT